jgi:hypothetical protein
LVFLKHIYLIIQIYLPFSFVTFAAHKHFIN